MSTVSFKDLKRNSTSSFEKLNKELEKINKPAYDNDDSRLWTCQKDKAGNGYAIIRFLPSAPQDGEDGHGSESECLLRLLGLFHSSFVSAY